MGKMQNIVWLLSWLCCFMIIFPYGRSVEETLKNGTMRSWFYTFRAFSGRILSWVDGGSTETWYRTCGIGGDADFWLFTKHVSLGREIPDVIYVDVEAELKKCFNENTGMSLSCYSNHFEVYIHRGENAVDVLSVDINAVLDTFSPVYNISNDTLLTPTPSKINRTFSFPRNNAKSVTFAFRSRGACGKLYRMKMYYYYCEEIFVNSVRFEKTSSPASGSKAVSANCSAHSVPSTAANFTGFCLSNGTWNINETLQCLCVKGYEPNEKLGCSLCHEGNFKTGLSNSKCARCPSNSKSNKTRTSCRCEDGFYRYNQSIFSQCYGLVNFTGDQPLFDWIKETSNLTWRPANAEDSLKEEIFYDVECFSCNQAVCEEPYREAVYKPQQRNLSQTWVIVSGLKPNTAYKFRVFPKNSLNANMPSDKRPFAETSRITINAGTKAQASSDSITEYIIIAVISLLLLVLVILLVIFICRRRDKRINKNGSYLDSGVVLPSIGQKTYVDPTNYDDPEMAVQELANELDPTSIFLEKLIGGGEFGDVYKGEMTTSENKKVPVAVKVLKHDASPKSARDFLLEASVMGQFNNPNVVRLEGVVVKSTPRMIVLEYMSNGSLENYLKSNDGKLTQLQLIGMARGVASGMKYLSEINFVHRDLAARNILVSESTLCKISDFGLSRELESHDSSRGEYSATGGKIPVRWTAPEAINYRKFSTASDVWSYGILLWEIMSFAQRPYWEWDNFKVMEQVDTGFRLPAPQDCPVSVHKLMLECWKKDRNERPTFAQITVVLDKWIASPETIDTDVDFMSSVGEWLASIKMSNYETLFLKAGYRRQSDVVSLKEDDLKAIGIKLIGHRNKMIKSIRSLEPLPLRQSVAI